ncbi:MAG: hypothetical protein ACJ72D_06200 [Marmoricola sp.]
MTAAAALVLGAYLLGATLRVVEVDPNAPNDVRLASMVISGALLGLGGSLFSVAAWRLWMSE